MPMSTRINSRFVHLLLVLIIFVLTMIGIWNQNWRNDKLFLAAIIVVIVGSHWFYEDGLWKLGFRPHDFKGCFLRYGKILLGLIVLILCLGLMFRTLRYSDPNRLAGNLMADVIVGLFQQYLVNGFFLNRLVGFFGDESDPRVPWIASATFALIHAPNWFLMLVTFSGGWMCSKIFLKYRNLYFLGLAHGLIKWLLYLFVPDTIAHGFVIGPGYFLH